MRSPQRDAVKAGTMQQEHEAHLQRLLAWVSRHADRKHRPRPGGAWRGVVGGAVLLREVHAETFDLLAYGQALEEHAARIFQDYDPGRSRRTTRSRGWSLANKTPPSSCQDTILRVLLAQLKDLAEKRHIFVRTGVPRVGARRGW